MALIKIVLLIYGLLMAGGGCMGFIKAKSKASLIMGIVSGLLIFLGVYLLEGNFKIGQFLVTFVSGILSVVFFMRLMKTRSLMPSGILFLLSIVIWILCVTQLPKFS